MDGALGIRDTSLSSVRQRIMSKKMLNIYIFPLCVKDFLIKKNEFAFFVQKKATRPRMRRLF